MVGKEGGGYCAGEGEEGDGGFEGGVVWVGELHEKGFEDDVGVF